MQLTTELGLKINEKKLQLQPTQCLVHLGISIDTVHNVFRILPARLKKIVLAAKNLLCVAKSAACK